MSPPQANKNNGNKISQYLLEELLVAQAVGAIYLAKVEASGEAVFLVTLQPEAAKSSDLSDRFLRRAETIAQLKHETILPVQDYGVADKRPFAVMPYQPGQFLAKQLETQSGTAAADKTAVIQSLTLVKQIASGLSAAHPTGLIHHNLRPENIYLDTSGNPYLLDLVVPPGPPITSQTEQEAASELDYQSPEQLAGKTLSGRSNIFSLGILLYRLLAGRLPPLPVSEWDIFEHKGMAREVPLSQVRPGLTSATYQAVQDSIWQKEWSRFETIEAQIKAFGRAIKQESAPPPPPPPAWLKALTWLRQPKTLKILIPATILLFLLILALLFMRNRSNQNQPEIEEPVPSTAVLSVEDNSVMLATPEVETVPSINSLTTTPINAEVDGNPAATATETATASLVPSVAPTETAVPTTVPTQTINSTSTPQASGTPTSEPTPSSCVPTPPFGWVRYNIQPNDSLSTLGQATNTTVAQLQQVNCLDTILLSIDQSIWIPSLP